MPFRKSVMILFLLLFIGSKSQAITYYSRQSGLWNQTASWSTVTYGSPVNTGTFPQSGDVVFIGDGHNITLNMNSVTASITVGQGTSGSLLYSGFLTFNTTIAGSLTVNNGATFGYFGNFGRTHRCFISGNLTNNGTVDLYRDADDMVNLVFNSAINTVVSGSGNWDLNRVTVFKSTFTSYRVEAQSNAFENAIRDLVVSYGTFLHNNSGTYQVNPAGSDFSIPASAIVAVQSGVLHLSPNTDNVYLSGMLDVRGGECIIGSSSGLQGIRYNQSGSAIPAILVSNGVLTVNGGITHRPGFAGDPLRYSQSGGVVNLQSGSIGTSEHVFFIVNQASSRFTLSNGTINIAKPSNGGAAKTDFSICGSSGTVSVTSGFVNFGTASTPSGSVFNFVPYAGTVLPHFAVTGPAAASVTLQTSENSTSDFNLLSLRIDANKTFDVRSISGVSGDSKVMTLSDNFDNVHAFYNNGSFQARSGTVRLQGMEGLWIGGSVTTDFYDLSINNSFGVSLGSNANVSNFLFMSNGVLYTSTSALLTILANGSANIGSALSFVDGPLAKIVAATSPQTLNLPVGKVSSYRPIILAVQHSNTTPVTYTSEVWNASARAFGYALPPTLRWVSDIRYYTLTRTPVANLTSARVTLSYGTDDVVNDYANLRVARDNGSSAWLDIGGTGTANGSGSITSGTFNAFNTYFTLSNSIGGINPLPVELVSFNARNLEREVMLEWMTATEKNNDFFEIQRSATGIDFEVIGETPGAGNSTNRVDYQFTDPSPLHGISYYRLRQVDMDGNFEYSELRAVKRGQTGTPGIYPNPSSNGCFSIRTAGSTSELIAVLYDLQGRLIYSDVLRPDPAGFAHFNAGSTVATGRYLLRVTDEAGNRSDYKVHFIR